jgi:hypothetical protein
MLPVDRRVARLWRARAASELSLVAPRSPALLLFGAYGLSAGTSGIALVGVDAALHAQSPQAEHSDHPLGDPLLGIHAPPPIASGSMLWILVLLAGVISIGLVLADDLGVGPRHRGPRSPWIRRPPWI